MTIRLTYLILIFYFIILWIFLNIWGIDAVKGIIDFEFFADSKTYMGHAEDGITLFEMLFLNPNLIGPVYLSRALFNNYNLIFLFNAFTLFYSYRLITVHFNINRYLLLFLWILSPMMISSVLTINKEIVAVLSSVLLLVYIQEKRIGYLIGAIILSLFVRWQQVLFVLLLISLYSRLNPFRDRMKLSFILLLLGVAILYPLAMMGTVEAMMDTSERMTVDESGSGVYFLFNKLQAIPLAYAFLFLPKLLFLLFSSLTRIRSFGDIATFYNDTVVISQCICYLGISIFLYLKKRMTFDNMFFFSALVYCLLFTLSPIFAPRYLFIFYVYSCIAVSQIIQKPEEKLD